MLPLVVLWSDRNEFLMTLLLCLQNSGRSFHTGLSLEHSESKSICAVKLECVPNSRSVGYTVSLRNHAYVVQTVRHSLRWREKLVSAQSRLWEQISGIGYPIFYDKKACSHPPPHSREGNLSYRIATIVLRLLLKPTEILSSTRRSE